MGQKSLIIAQMRNLKNCRQHQITSDWQQITVLYQNDSKFTNCWLFGVCLFFLKKQDSRNYEVHIYITVCCKV
jgi:hypothetical protein